MESKKVKELNSQLEGVIMGEKEFIKLIEKAKDEKLVELLNNNIDSIKSHKEVLVNEINSLNEEETKDEGALGKVIEFFSGFTNMTIDTDKKVAKAALKGIEMGYTSINDLMIKDVELSKELSSRLIDISKSYSKGINSIQKYLFE